MRCVSESLTCPRPARPPLLPRRRPSTGRHPSARRLALAASLLLAGAARGEPPAATTRPAGTGPEQVVRVGANQRVTMHVSNLPLTDVLRMLSEPTRRNIIMSEGVKGTVSASLYNVSLDTALKAILVSNGLGYRTDGDFIHIQPADELARAEAAGRKLSSRIFKLTYINAASAQALLQPMLTPNVGKVSVTPAASRGLGGGGSTGTGVKDTEGDALASPDTLLITDYTDRLEEVARVLAQLDVRPKQVLIEATILRATLNEDNALGIDFTTVGGVDFATLSSVSPGAQNIATGNIPTAELNNTNFTVRTDLNGGLPGGGFTFGILKDQVGVFIRALEQITDTDVLANPKILALNKQVGQVIVGRRDGYLTTTITETTAIQQVEFLETGTVLTFRPFIGDDGLIRMEIHPKDSTGGLTEANLPFEQTTEVTTNIMVRDGHTILIGGLFREVSTATRGQTPLLGDLPGVGALFRRTRDTTVREEVIILLTVHVLKGDDDLNAAEELAQDVERIRVGMRQGLQWFGRERLAEAHYRWAMEHFARGDHGRALWDAELALHNFPRHVDAAKLKEKLTGRRDWEAEASSIRRYLTDRILEERGLPAAPYGRPGFSHLESEQINGPIGFDYGDMEETDLSLALPEPNEEGTP
jgi:type IV pilus secretin PilQ/predicted competence protein